MVYSFVIKALNNVVASFSFVAFVHFISDLRQTLKNTFAYLENNPKAIFFNYKITTQGFFLYYLNLILCQLYFSDINYIYLPLHFPINTILIMFLISPLSTCFSSNFVVKSFLDTSALSPFSVLFLGL